jgi:plastocyanin
MPRPAMRLSDTPDFKDTSMPRSRFACLLVLAALPLAAACGSDDDPASAKAASFPAPAAQDTAPADDAAPAELVVDMAASQFAPAKITASVGQTIRWTNSDAIAHTATATEGAGFDSGTIEGGGEFTYTTRKAGQISYVCVFHPGMTGTITVR